MAFTKENAAEMNARRKTHSGGKTASRQLDPNTSREEVSEIISHATYWFGRDRAKTDDDVLSRLEEFFLRCEETGELPTVEKMCLALGVTRMTLNRWERGELGASRAIIVQQAKEALAAIDAELVQHGKIPVVSYIFRSCNFYQMTNYKNGGNEDTSLLDNRLGEEGNKEQLALQYANSVPAITSNPYDAIPSEE